MIIRTSPALLALTVLCGNSLGPHGFVHERFSDGEQLVLSLSAGRDTTAVPQAAPDTVAGSHPTTDTIQVASQEPRDERSEGLRGFDRRASSNKLGYFLSEQQIQAMHPQYTSDALRRVPGVVVRGSHGIGNEVLIRGCAPLVWVDGQRAPGAQVDDVSHGNDVAGLEIYSSLAGVPAEFTDRTATCGTILVWHKTS